MEPLAGPAAWGRLAVVELLIEFGADVNALRPFAYWQTWWKLVDPWRALVGGSAGVYLPDITTRAFVGDDPDDGVMYFGTTDVHARGTVLVAADDDLELDLIAGSAGGAGTVGIGASGSVNVVTKKTEAFIGSGARVTGDAMQPTGVDAHTGQFVVSYQSVPALNGGGSITFDPHAATVPDTITRSQGSWTSDGKYA